MSGRRRIQPALNAIVPAIQFVSESSSLSAAETARTSPEAAGSVAGAPQPAADINALIAQAAKILHCPHTISGCPTSRF